MAEEVAQSKPMVGTSWESLTARLCESCGALASQLYCRADSAFLCSGCDAAAESSHHERVWICEVCEQAPASVTCKADAAALCVACDADIHSANPLARRHVRLPLADARPACVDDLDAAYWLPHNDRPAIGPTVDSSSAAGDCFSDEVDSYLGLDSPTDTAGADSVVPVNTKPSMQHLLAYPASSNCIEIDFRQSKAIFNFPAPSLRQSESSPSMDVGVVPEGIGGGVTEVSYPSYEWTAKGGSSSAAVALDREARVLRYREKRKKRKFKKTIRYASRKAYAETRPRIKGRFAKRAEADGEVDRIFSQAAHEILVNGGYGVVPSF